MKSTVCFRSEDMCFCIGDIKLILHYKCKLQICQETFKNKMVFIQIYELLPVIQMSFREFCELIIG